MTADIPLLRAEGLRRVFGGLAAVDGVTLTLRPGDRHAVIGPNGAGKSTLLGLLAGTIRATSGRIHWYGHEITRRGPVHRARAGIARSFQTPTVVPTLSTLDNLVLGGWPRWPPASRGLPDTRRPWWPAGRYPALRVEALARLASLGLDGLADVPAANLSHGQRRLLDIGMALAGDPDLLLLDEPAAGLDSDGVAGGADLERLLGLLAAVPDRTAIVLVEHHLDVVAAVAQTVTVLHQGRVLGEGRHDEIVTDPRVWAAYPGLTVRGRSFASGSDPLAAGSVDRAAG